MTRYAVEVTETALAAIKAQARYIAEDAQAPISAQRWLERIWDAVESLEEFPYRTAVAEESEYLEFEVRQLLVDSHLLLLRVDDDQRKVWIIGLRHGSSLPEKPD